MTVTCIYCKRPADAEHRCANGDAVRTRLPVVCAARGPARVYSFPTGHEVAAALVAQRQPRIDYCADAIKAAFVRRDPNA